MAKLLLIDVTATDRDRVKSVECDDIDDYYKYLKCGCFDIAHRKVGDKYYDIFVDDEGLLKDNPVVSAIRFNRDMYEPMLVGNLIFANHDAEGNTTSLSKDDVENIISHTFLWEHDNIESPIVVCDY